MIQKRLNKYRYEAGVAFFILIVVIYKFRFLFLPYYWDEAWPYSVGVHDLYDSGLSLMPGSIDTFVARGHPLMFHFLAASWMKIFGTGLLSGHSFAMFISVSLIVVTYSFCKTFFSERVGFVASLLLACQPVFIAQSAFLMPEMLMALWTMLCFQTYFKGKKILFVICGTAMLLTKESGGVFFVSLFLCELFSFQFSQHKDFRSLCGKLLLVAVPVVLASINFIIQKIKFGWFLYPFYMDYMVSPWKNFSENISSASAYAFIYDGRNGISVFIILSLLMILLWEKRNFDQIEKKTMAFFSVFIILYLIFSAVNYYIARYLMCIFPCFVIISAILIDKALYRIRLVHSLIILGLMITGLYYYFQPKKNGDMDYSPSVKADIQVVDYFQSAQLFNNNIVVPSVLRIDFTEPYAGYLAGGKFNNIQSQASDKAEYYIISSDENDGGLRQSLIESKNQQLVKKIEVGYAWREIYKTIR